MFEVRLQVQFLGSKHNYFLKKQNPFIWASTPFLSSSPGLSIGANIKGNSFQGHHINSLLGEGMSEGRRTSN